MVYSTDRSKAVVPVLVLLFVALWFTRRFVLCLTLCHFVLVFFSHFSIAITSLGEERANISAFRTFALRKHTYSNILKILQPKTGKSNIFHISAQNIDCRYSLEPLQRGGSNEYPQSMF